MAWPQAIETKQSMKEGEQGREENEITTSVRRPSLKHKRRRSSSSRVSFERFKAIDNCGTVTNTHSNNSNAGIDDDIEDISAEFSVGEPIKVSQSSDVSYLEIATSETPPNDRMIAKQPSSRTIDNLYSTERKKLRTGELVTQKGTLTDRSRSTLLLKKMMNEVTSVELDIIQRHLGVDEKGRCLRHPNQTICGKVNEHRFGSVLLCRICESEIMAGGQKQRRSMAIVIGALKTMQKDRRQWREKTKLMHHGKAYQSDEESFSSDDLRSTGTASLDGMLKFCESVDDDQLTKGDHEHDYDNDDAEWKDEVYARVAQVRAWDGKAALKCNPIYAKYFRMQEYGIPLDAIKQNCQLDGWDPRILDLDPNKPLKSQLILATNMTEEEKEDLLWCVSHTGDQSDNAPEDIRKIVDRVHGAYCKRKDVLDDHLIEQNKEKDSKKWIGEDVGNFFKRSPPQQKTETIPKAGGEDGDGDDSDVDISSVEKEGADSRDVSTVGDLPKIIDVELDSDDEESSDSARSDRSVTSEASASSTKKKHRKDKKTKAKGLIFSRKPKLKSKLEKASSERSVSSRSRKNSKGSKLEKSSSERQFSSHSRKKSAGSKLKKSSSERHLSGKNSAVSKLEKASSEKHLSSSHSRKTSSSSKLKKSSSERHLSSKLKKSSSERHISGHSRKSSGRPKPKKVNSERKLNHNKSELNHNKSEIEDSNHDSISSQQSLMSTQSAKSILSVKSAFSARSLKSARSLRLKVQRNKSDMVVKTKSDSVALRSELENANRVIAEKEIVTSSLVAQVDSLELALSEMKNGSETVTKKNDVDVDVLKSQLADAEQKLSERNTIVSSLVAQVQNLQKLLEAKEKLISAQAAQIENVHRQLEVAKDRVVGRLQTRNTENGTNGTTVISPSGKSDAEIKAVESQTKSIQRETSNDSKESVLPELMNFLHHSSGSLSIHEPKLPISEVIVAVSTGKPAPPQSDEYTVPLSGDEEENTKQMALQVKKKKRKPRKNGRERRSRKQKQHGKRKKRASRRKKRKENLDPEYLRKLFKDSVNKLIEVNRSMNKKFEREISADRKSFDRSSSVLDNWVAPAEWNDFFSDEEGDSDEDIDKTLPSIALSNKSLEESVGNTPSQINPGSKSTKGILKRQTAASTVSVKSNTARFFRWLGEDPVFREFSIDKIPSDLKNDLWYTSEDYRIFAFEKYMDENQDEFELVESDDEENSYYEEESYYSGSSSSYTEEELTASYVDEELSDSEYTIESDKEIEVKPNRRRSIL